MKLPPSNSNAHSRAGRPAPAGRTGTNGELRLNTDPRAAQRGVALIITLIMLAVITFMAVTFLVLSRRERNAASSATDQLIARNAAESGYQRAVDELLAPMLAFTNDQAVSILVSTNYVNAYGYDPTAPLPADGSNPTNVNYFYQAVPGNPPLQPIQALQNLANLQFNPRPPVFVTNKFIGGKDFNYFIDLNRNGIAETNGWLPVLDTNGQAVVFAPGLTNYNFFVGDPEWIGVLERPDWPHSASNRFVARYAYLVVPASQTLDVNYIYNNSALNTDPNGLPYRRNMGMGSWEINLAAFLADLNTNQWLAVPPPSPSYYDYQPLLAPNGVASGRAFFHAQQLLNYRYNGTYNNLYSVNQLLGAVGSGIVQNDFNDEYGGGAPFMTGTRLPIFDPDSQNSRTPEGWPGADNPNHFFTTQDLFDGSKVGGPPPNFVATLSQAGLGRSTYDRYTFYRLLEQMGTDSAPDLNKMNLNYRNISNGVVVVGMETNFLPWAPLEFFTNAAQRIFNKLRLPDPSDPTRIIDAFNIPVFPNNAYTPAVHRVLQLSANMFDAAGNNTNSPFPTIFRPVFIKRNGIEIVIAGFELVNGPGTPWADTTTPASFLSMPLDLLDPADRNAVLATPTYVNFYGVPWIIGARKGFPNLNQVAMETITTLSRRILTTNTEPTASGLGRLRFTQMMEIGISNIIGVQVWNSYSNAYPRPLYVQTDGELTMVLTNSDSFQYPPTPVKFQIGGPIIGLGATQLVANALQGTGWGPGNARSTPNPKSFVIPLLTNFTFVPFAQYRQAPPGLFQIPANQTLTWSLNQQNVFLEPRWTLSMTNRLRCLIVDGGSGGRVVDYVQLAGLDASRDLSAEATSDDRFGMFATNSAKFGPLTMPEGVVNQLRIALGNPPVGDDTWSEYGGVGARSDSITKFTQYVYGNNGNQPGPVPAMQVPFTASARRYQILTWQANDPLVHYLASDLYFAPASNNVPLTASSLIPSVTNNFYTWNNRYSPWNGRPTGTPESDPYAWETAVKDPALWSSDFWDFPNNKFPNIGWLGRVHRGTPWQTVYMKSTDMTRTNLAGWGDWAGVPNFVVQPATLPPVPVGLISAPFNDWQLFDLFTTAINENASRGRLSVNQTGLAAWSAVLSGVIVLTNTPAGPAPLVIEPAGPFDPTFGPLPPVAQIVQGIYNAHFLTNRFGFPVFRNRTFGSAGEVLSAAELTERSPFLNTTNLHSLAAGGITDEIMERIPQQIMSLLTLNHTPRFVIYSFGQTLKPADTLYMGNLGNGQFFRMCTNYQVTAETYTRTVVRVDGSFDPRYIPTLQTNVSTFPRPDPYGRFYPPRIVVEQFNVFPAN